MSTVLQTSVEAQPSSQIYLHDHEMISHDVSHPAFIVTSSRGFLPRVNPPAELPPAFASLESLLQRMPIKQASGDPGLLAQGTLGLSVLQELPDLSAQVEKVKDDLVLIGALYRDYSFLASAYLLEPCHLSHVKGEGYGLGREVLPSVIAKPLALVAKISGFAPFMEYAGSYALFNYRLQDPSKGFEYSNLRLVRAFEHGIADNTSSEAGFVLVHIDMVKHSGELVQGVMDSLNAAASRDRTDFDDSMQSVLSAMRKVNKVMESMWTKSKPHQYTNFRTFIFGITSQSMFPNGVVYEGVDTEPKAFRGESGANDSMIPLMDNLLQISMPQNPLTEILNDFRSYRPGSHRGFLLWVNDRSKVIGLKDFAMLNSASAMLYLKCLDQVREFRARHWAFVREYILRRTTHAVATGGSPIVTWLPNQLQAVLEAMIAIDDHFLSQGEKLWACESMIQSARDQREVLLKEVEKLASQRSEAALVPFKA